MRWITGVLAACGVLAFAGGAFAAPSTQVVAELRHDTGPPLAARPAFLLQPFDLAATPSPSASFAGVGGSEHRTPPSPSGDVGPNDYVQWVNGRFAIFDKGSGAVTYGPVAGNTLWSGFGNPADASDPANLCETTNPGGHLGGGLVLYDSLADRWFLSRLTYGDVNEGPYVECMAVSATGDPAGAYHRYAFLLSDTLQIALPATAVWSDGYYMSFDRVDPHSTCPFGSIRGSATAVFDRARMLAGAAATAQILDPTGTDPAGCPHFPIQLGLQPADLDGSKPPPPGAPGLFVASSGHFQFFDPDSLKIWELHVDWSNPAASTLARIATLPVSPFVEPSGHSVPEPAPGVPLGVYPNGLRYRVSYRNFGPSQTLLASQDVLTYGAVPDRPIVVRWYELRNTKAWSVVQQGTLAPADGVDRWSSSIAMNGAHDVALGYAIANETTNPGIRYSARQPEDPPGVLRPEAVLVNGGGVQTDHPFGAWGLYSSTTVDPSDDCTFWTTNAYYAATSADDWSTRIGSFDLPNCPAAPAIASFAPASGPEGTTVTIAGRGFVDVKSVKLSRKPMQFTVDSATQIHARVPSGATSGPITVRTSAGTDTSASSFTVTP